MTAFDDLTLGEVEELQTTVLKGVSLAEADPLMLAGGVMWVTQRKENPALTWDDFKGSIKMGDIKAFSESMQAEEANPTQALSVPQS